MKKIMRLGGVWLVLSLLLGGCAFHQVEPEVQCLTEAQRQFWEERRQETMARMQVLASAVQTDVPSTAAFYAAFEVLGHLKTLDTLAKEASGLSGYEQQVQVVRKSCQGFAARFPTEKQLAELLALPLDYYADALYYLADPPDPEGIGKKVATQGASFELICCLGYGGVSLEVIDTMISQIFLQNVAGVVPRSERGTRGRI